MVRKKCYINFNNKNAGIYISVRQNKFCDKNIFIIMKSIIKRHININIYISHNRIIKHMRQKLIEQVDRKSVKTWKIWGTLSTNKSKIQIIFKCRWYTYYDRSFSGPHNNSQLI